MFSLKELRTHTPHVRSQGKRERRDKETRMYIYWQKEREERALPQKYPGLKIQKSDTEKKGGFFSPKYADEIDVLPTHTIARMLLMYAISDVREKYGSRHNVSLISPQEHAFFANFHSPVAAAIDRFAWNSIARNYLFGHGARNNLLGNLQHQWSIER